MKNSDVKQKLKQFKRQYQWLSDATGYKLSYINNKLGKVEKTLPARFANACEKAFEEENKRQSDVDVLQEVTRALQKSEAYPTETPTSQQASIWDQITFTATQSMQHAEAAKLQGFAELGEYFKYAICHYTDNVLSTKKPNGEKDQQIA